MPRGRELDTSAVVRSHYVLTAYADIDSIDCEIMEAVLQARFSPEVILIETNPAYPPPVDFALKHGVSITENKPRTEQDATRLRL